MIQLTVRNPAVAGSFYPADINQINALIQSFNVSIPEHKINAFGIVSPHAGYVYSGKTAFMGFSSINIKKNIIIIGPNHTGLGAAFSVMNEGNYNFGSFNVPINSALADEIINQSDSPFQHDDKAQLKEHSLEVQIPLIHYFMTDFSIVPLVISYVRYNDVIKAAKAIYNAIVKLNLLDDVLVVASSDMTHYESAEEAEMKDSIAINEILRLDSEGLYNKVINNNISMCGFIPVSIMLLIAKMAGKNNAKLINYTNSGEASGDYSSVVGYSSIAVY
ncbi:MAG: AmmeMemoRadiSam system protein B [Candidatus Acididesulfobacter guangdongensis]|uniref:MEMO1 family protein EVJ46_03105 n=1 Tax=Acididesulfobacter guangdongensis TaxID=2597225 RepID=A0A519BIZ5_ACIG2|nr:MAG: AmmeMemoRadiSam system protein B [Candidatus Acididesulfobacter guangdongensis]